MTKIKKVISVVLFVFLFSFLGYSQQMDTVKVVKIEGDTLVLITPRHLNLINGIIVEREALIETTRLQKEIIFNSEAVINQKDSIIQNHSIMLDKQENHYTYTVNLFEAELEKERRKNKINNTVLGSIGGVLVGLLVTSLLVN